MKLGSLDRAYNRAKFALIEERDRQFPPGTRVRLNLTGGVYTVTPGSLYADQILLDGHMHVSWGSVEVIDG